MSDPLEKPADEGGFAGDRSSDEIARSLGSLWQRLSGQRPKSTTVEVTRDVVRCVIEEGTPDAEAGDVEAEAGDVDAEPVATPGSLTHSAGFKHNATTAVAKITGRRVIAFIPKRDKETEVSTQTFHLDRPRRRS